MLQENVQHNGVSHSNARFSELWFYMREGKLLFTNMQKYSMLKNTFVSHGRTCIVGSVNHVVGKVDE